VVEHWQCAAPTTAMKHSQHLLRIANLYDVEMMSKPLVQCRRSLR
jgi:hypothetical protein